MRGFEGALKALAFAATVLVAASCTPAPELCGGVACSEGQECVNDQCVDPIPANCRNEDGTAKQCPAGRGCDPVDGECRNLCQNVTCEGDLKCKPETGKCADLCAGVTCTDPTRRCYADSGKCEAKCKADTCADDEACTPTTGECTKRCETTTKPAGGAECATGEKCDPESGECVLRCFGVSCPGGVTSTRYAQHCDPTNGRCVSGKPPAGTVGAACADADACNRVPVGPEQTVECLTDLDGEEGDEFPDGYCTATCVAAADCPAGSICVGGIGCLDKCTGAAQCQSDDYMCLGLDQLVQNAPEGEYVCLPKSFVGAECTAADPANCIPVGGDCTDAGQCVDGSFCIEETNANGEFSGFEGGMCFAQARATDRCPAGSTLIPLTETDAYCLKSCVPGQVGACSRGEKCWSLGQGFDFCWFEDCDTDVDCALAGCTATDLEACGAGQTCTNIVDGRGECKTAAKCDAVTPCPGGEACNAGECRPNYCDAALGQCRAPGCSTTPVDSCAETGAVCNPTSGKCERACTRDEACAGTPLGQPNAVCAASGQCEAACTARNEEAVCGAERVCNLATGKCAPRCTADEECTGGTICNTVSGRCERRCNDPVAPADCGTGNTCNSETGRCQVKCTIATEATVCGAEARCQVWSGLCYSDCRTDALECGTAPCSVKDDYGYCGADCTNDLACGTEPNGFRLKCATIAPRKCDFVACSETTPCANASDTCVEGKCKLPVAP